MKFKYFYILLTTLLLFSATALAQTPGTSQYPGAIDTQDTLIQTANRSATSLSLAVGIADTSATVSSTSLFPATGTFTIDDEILFYTGKTATTFTGLLRGQDGSVAAAHASGSPVQLRIISRTHMVHSDAIVSIQTKLGSGSSVPIAGTFMMGTGAGTSVWKNPSVVQSDGPLTLASGGTNQNITLTPSGTGVVTTLSSVGIGTTQIASGQKLEINGGLNLTTATAQPACNATTRGTFWIVQSAAGVKDRVEVCGKDAADVYAWRVIY